MIKSRKGLLPFFKLYIHCSAHSVGIAAIYRHSSLIPTRDWTWKDPYTLESDWRHCPLCYYYYFTNKFLVYTREFEWEGWKGEVCCDYKWVQPCWIPHRVGMLLLFMCGSLWGKAERDVCLNGISAMDLRKKKCLIPRVQSFPVVLK